jgi:hypothetical protein
LEQLKTLSVPVASSGTGVDMNALSKMFASKLPPENTINRIEELEKLWANFNARLEGLEKNNELTDLKARVTELEKNSKGEAYY